MPKKLPPHLPPPVCNIEDHKKWLRLKLILASAAFGLLAGLSGASILLGWIWPGYGGEDVWTVTEQNRSALSKVQLEEKIAKEIQDRIFTVYARETAFSVGSYLKKTDKLGESVAISSDGWLAMYLPDYNGSYKNWRVLSPIGTVYTPAKAVFDKYAGIVYLKLSNITTQGQTSQLKVVNFSEAPRVFDEIFIYQDGNWVKNSLGYPVYPLDSAHLDTIPNVLFGLGDGSSSGAVAINSQGRMVGFITNEGMLLSNVYLTRVMPEVLNKQTVLYPSLGVDGWFSVEQPVVVEDEKVKGFAVSRVWATGSPLKKGDIILEINGRPIETVDYLWYNKNETVSLKVMRGGEIIEIESKVFEV